MTTQEERIRMARAFLHEAVFRSRERQAMGVALAGGGLDQPSSSANCGLGEKATVILDLSPRGAEIFDELWPHTPPPTEIDRIQEVMTSWVRLQDALDRKRNHFLRDFRQAHGFDRQAYAPDEADAFETGLERINVEVRKQQDAAAHELLTR